MMLTHSCLAREPLLAGLRQGKYLFLYFISFFKRNLFFYFKLIFEVFLYCFNVLNLLMLKIYFKK